MFSVAKAAEKLESLSAHYSRQGTIWVPEYHSISEIDSFNSHFKTIAEKAERSGQTFEDVLGYEEMRWIENEYNICACDYRYWSTRYAYINADGIRRFERRSSQQMLLDLWSEREEQGFSIEQQILKARQQGISTEVEMAITHQVNFGVGVKAGVASYDADACERMAGMMQLAFNEMPAWMQATPTSDRAGSLMAFANTQTRLTLYSGKKATGIARGDTPTVLHLSEVCEFPNAVNVIENSLFQAVHPVPGVFMILESTGKGNTDWWARTWYSSRDYWASGGARLQPVFFPWFLASDLFPTTTWRREHQVPAKWSPIPETMRMMTKAASYVHNTPLIRKFLGDDWQMPNWQAYFWEVKLLEYRRKDNENGWLQEMPMDDVEALRPKKDLVFDVQAVQKIDEHRPRYTAWSIIGEQIQERYHPDPSLIDYDRERVIVTYDGKASVTEGEQSKTFEWVLVPLKQPVEKGIDIFDADMKLLISEWPEEDYDYGIGVDNSSGVEGGEDNTAICVIGKPRLPGLPSKQVAELASNRMPAALAHAWVMAISALYHMNEEPVVGIEQVYGMGDTTQIQMGTMGYKRFYRFSRLDGKNPERDKKRSKRLGWFTNEWSRNFMLTMYKAAIENGWLQLFSPHLIRNELASFQIDKTGAGKTRWEHQQGKHDDRIFASAIAYIIMNDTESLSHLMDNKCKTESEDVSVNYDYPTGYNVSYDELAEEYGYDAA